MGFFIFVSMFYIYIICSEKFDKYYIGSSQNPWQRLEKHNTSLFNTFTSKYRPWVLKAVFEVGNTRGEAEKIEKFIKSQKTKNILIKLTNPDFTPNDKLAQPAFVSADRLVRVPHLRD